MLRAPCQLPGNHLKRLGRVGPGLTDAAGPCIESHVTFCKFHHRSRSGRWQHARRDHRTAGSHGGAGRHDLDPVHPAGNHHSQHCQHWRERRSPCCPADAGGSAPRAARPDSLRPGRRFGRRRRQHSSESVQPHGLERQPHNRFGRQGESIRAGRAVQAFSNTAAMNSAIASANNATLASVASNYALRTVTDQLALDLAAKQSGPDVDLKIATALLDRPSTTDLAAAVNLKTTPADVDQRVATALL